MNRRWLAIGGIALATLSCQVILGLEEPIGIPGEPPVEPTPEAGVKDPCPHAGPPKKGPDDDPDTKLEFWFATQSVRAPLGPDEGFDLDGACTCGADFHDGGPPCTISKTVCDRDGGIDDAVGVVFGGLPLVDPLKPVNNNLAGGSHTLLLYLADYNGQKNDANVQVWFVNSGGLYTDVGCDGNPRGLAVSYGHAPNDNHTPPDHDRYFPAFDGCDHFSPDEGTISEALRRPGITVGAYVTNSQLVIDKIDQVVTSMFGSRATINAPLFVANIVQDGNHLRLDAVLGGRLPFDDLVQILGGNEAGSFSDPDAGDDYKAVCEVPIIWSQAKPRLCEARDVMATKEQDFSKTLRTCDATSLTFGFTMVEAKIASFDFTNKVGSKTCPPVTCP